MKRPTLLAAIAAVLFAASPAAAQRRGSRAQAQIMAQAREHYERGVQQYRALEYQAALEAFQHAQELVPDPPNLYNIARCFERLARFREAADSLQQYLEADLPADRRESATRLYEQIRSRPGELEISSSPAGATLFIDRDFDRPRGLTPAAIELPPGQHELTLRLAGRAEVTLTVTVAFASRDSILIELPEASARPGDAGTMVPTVTAIAPRFDPNRRPRAFALWLSLGGGIGLTPQALLGMWGGSLGVHYGFGIERNLRLGFEAGIYPIVPAIFADATVLGEIALKAGEGIEVDFRLGLGLGYLQVGAAGLQVPKGGYAIPLVRLGVGTTYRVNDQWAVRAMVGSDAYLGGPTNLATAPGGYPVVRVRADVAVVMSL